MFETFKQMKPTRLGFLKLWSTVDGG